MYTLKILDRECRRRSHHRYHVHNTALQALNAPTDHQGALCPLDFGMTEGILGVTQGIRPYALCHPLARSARMLHLFY